ncbi:MAG: hypothetical protein ACLP7W_02585, partial [Solirubrobacteraceae bacterium]
LVSGWGVARGAAALAAGRAGLDGASVGAAGGVCLAAALDAGRCGRTVKVLSSWSPAGNGSPSAFAAATVILRALSMTMAMWGSLSCSSHPAGGCSERPRTTTQGPAKNVGA